MKLLAVAHGMIMALLGAFSSQTQLEALPGEDGDGGYLCHVSRVGDASVHEELLAWYEPPPLSSRLGSATELPGADEGAERWWDPTLRLQQRLMVHAFEHTYGIMGDLRVDDVTQVVDHARASLSQVLADVPEWSTDLSAGLVGTRGEGFTSWRHFMDKGMTLMGRAFSIRFNVQLIQLDSLSQAHPPQGCQA